MKPAVLSILLTLIAFTAMAQTKITLSTGSGTMTATLSDTEAARELAELLSKSPLTIEMNDYGGFEKVGTLPRSFTTSNRQITTSPGDIMLYQGNNMVIFYGSNSWSYTPLGRIDNATTANLRQFLGNGRVSLTISLAGHSGIDNITGDEPKKGVVYDLKGNLIVNRPLAPGLYIINGKKTLIRP